MVSTIHLFEDITWDVHPIPVLIFHKNFVGVDFTYDQIRSLWEPFPKTELLRIPQRFSLNLSYFSGAQSCCEDKWSSLNKLLGDCCLILAIADFSEISDLELSGRPNCIPWVLHYWEHQIAIFIDFYYSEANTSFCKFLHLVLNLEAVGRASRVVISYWVVCQVNPVPRCIADEKGLLDWVTHPVEVQSLVQATLDVFRPVLTPISCQFTDESFNRVKVVAEACDTEALDFCDVTVADEGDANIEALVLGSDIVDNLMEGLLWSFYPLLHRAGAVHQETQVEGGTKKGIITTFGWPGGFNWFRDQFRLWTGVDCSFGGMFLWHWSYL